MLTNKNLRNPLLSLSRETQGIALILHVPSFFCLFLYCVHNVLSESFGCITKISHFLKVCLHIYDCYSERNQRKGEWE